MRPSPSPRAHLFVCANRREGSPLGPGCGAGGDAVYDAMKREVAERGLVSEVWITRTQCLGVCPKAGATVACYPSDAPIRAGVTPDDVKALFEEARDATPPAPWSEIEREIGAAEELQSKKVLDLARRLAPGLTLEDIQNPHDFPELDDPDWHYADGILSGIQSVAAALRALKNRRT
jgi:(2Fe-2S) ferredoxin